MEAFELTWRPFFSPLSLAAAASGLALLAFFAYWRTFGERPRLSAGMLVMRLVLLAVLVLLLMGPSTAPPQTVRPGKSQLTVLLDTSASMLTPDMGDTSRGSTERFEFAVRTWLNDSRLSELGRSFAVELFGFDAALRPLDRRHLTRPAAEVATGKISNVAQSIRRALGEVDTELEGSAVLVISDGRDTFDTPFEPLARLAKARSIPIHAVSLGGATLQRDVAIVALPMQEYLLAGEEGTMMVRIQQTGYSAASTTLHLRRGDEHTSRRVAFEGRSSVAIELPVNHQAPGLYEYAVSVDPMEGDIETRNDKQSVFVEVTDARIEVLLLEGEPHWDTKFIAQSLRKDDRIALTQVSQVSTRKRESILTRAEPERRELPATADEFAAYDVIIVGRGLEHIYTPKEVGLLVEYVSEHGGRVVFARGRAYDPETSEGRLVGRALAPLEPVEWGQGVVNQQQIAVEPAGHAHPSFALAATPGGIEQVLEELPALAVLPEVSREKVLTRVLARSRSPGAARGSARRGQPAVVSMEHGRGTIVAILGEGLWRWSLLPADKKHLAGVFDRFWSNTVRWLALGGAFQPGQHLALRLSQRTVRIGDPIRFDVSSRSVTADDLGARLTVIDPSGGRHDVALHASGTSAFSRTAEFTPEMSGVHRVVVETPATIAAPVAAKFSAFDLDVERLQCAANPAALRLVTEASGGELLDPHSPQELARVLERRRAATVVPVELEYVWDEARILIFVLLWAGIEWLVRKKGGLL